jgi:hypothetical protein
MPKRRNVSVKELMSHFQNLPDVRDYLPSEELRGHRLPEAEFFFDIIATKAGGLLNEVLY